MLITNSCRSHFGPYHLSNSVTSHLEKLTNDPKEFARNVVIILDQCLNFNQHVKH